MEKYQHVLFDWDGCLYDSLPLWHATCSQMLKDLSLVVEDSVIAREIMPELNRVGEHGVTDVIAYCEMVLLKVRSEITAVEFQSGALALIEHLATANITHAVVTSADRQTIELILDHHQKAHLFPHIVTRNDVKKTKPHPEPIDKALKALQATGKALMVGDNFADIKAGQAAGVDTALYYPPSHDLYYDLKLLEELHPTYVIRHFDELISILNT